MNFKNQNKNVWEGIKSINSMAISISEEKKNLGIDLKCQKEVDNCD